MRRHAHSRGTRPAGRPAEPFSPVGFTQLDSRKPLLKQLLAAVAGTGSCLKSPQVFLTGGVQREGKTKFPEPTVPSGPAAGFPDVATDQHPPIQGPRQLADLIYLPPPPNKEDYMGTLASLLNHNSHNYKRPELKPHIVVHHEVL